MQRVRYFLALACVAVVFTIFSQTGARAAHAVNPQIEAAYAALLADPGVQKALAFIDADQANKVAELKEMVVMHGAPFKEKDLRAPMFKEKLTRYGARDAFIDAHANAFAWLGGGSGPAIVFEAHLDTVFPEETPLAIVEKNGRLYCPGIWDNTISMANLLSMLRAINHAGLKPVRPVLIGGTSGEEGEGDLRGVKGLLDDHKNIGAVLSLEPGNVNSIVYKGVGSRRFEFVFKGPGGHSWGAYGLPSPIHAMGRSIAKMADEDTTASPRTTYTVGVVSGGTSVNSIALEARCRLDMRSVSAKELATVEKRMRALVDKGVAEENAFRAKSGKAITVDHVLIGDRPAGEQPDDAPVVQAAWGAIRSVGGAPVLSGASSTNANAPISRGVPAVVLRTGGTGGGSHSHGEWCNPEGSQQGAKAALLMLFAVAGLEGVAEPVALR